MLNQLDELGTLKMLNNRYVFFIVYVILIVSMTGLSLDAVTWRTLEINNPFTPIFQVGVFLPGLLIAFTSHKKYKDQFSNSIWFFAWLCLFSLLININSFNRGSIIAAIFNVFILPIGVYYGKYLYDNFIQIKTTNLLFISLQLPAIFTGLFLLKLYFKFDSDCLFAIFGFFPLIFFIKWDLYKIILIVFYGAVILLGGKRSVFITYLLCLILYLWFIFFAKQTKSNNKSIKKALTILCIFIAIAYVITNFSSQIEYLSDRFSNIQEDRGSGREDIYTAIINSYLNSSIISQLFGHGYFAVVNKFEIGAHNDYLEILYDYGLFAELSYIFLTIKILYFSIKNYLRNRKQDLKASILLMNAIIIVILGLLNCMIVSTYFQFINFCALGITLEAIKIKKNG